MRTVLFALLLAVVLAQPALAHGGGLNSCGCHFNRKTGECHCHRPRSCGCACEPPECTHKLGVEALGEVRGRGETLGPEPPAAPGPQRPATAREVEPLAGACGVERWNVKTLSDPAAKGLHRQKPRAATVEELASLPAPPWSSRAPRSAAERRIYSVDGCAVAYALESDSDLHVVLRGASRATIIVEFPDPLNCAPLSHAPGLMQQARDAFIGLVPARPTPSFRYLQRAIPVTVTGPLFMDKIHGQEGVAPNGAEIHPVLRVKRRAGTCS
jgi:hypothetical protein